MPKPRVKMLDFLSTVRWLDGSPILDHIEDYRKRILSDVMDTFDGDRVRYTMALLGRGKKNGKSLDLVLMCLFACLANDSVRGNDVILIAGDEGQANDDLKLMKRLIEASPSLGRFLVIREKKVERKDGKGSITILPGNDIRGSHGKTARLVAIDELHVQRTNDLLEALALDPHRLDSQMIATSYASIHHVPDAPLNRYFKLGQEGSDERLYFSWYSASFGTDLNFSSLPTPEQRANPSIASFDPQYLETQRKRLADRHYRRLHLNEPSVPDDSPFAYEKIQAAIDRGVYYRPPISGIEYFAFVDPSRGSNDDFTLGIAHVDEQGRGVLDYLDNQGDRPPFDVRKVYPRFAAILKQYRVDYLAGDNALAEMSHFAWKDYGISYEVSMQSTTEIYDLFAPFLNSGQVSLLDHAECEKQFLGLQVSHNKVTHRNREHDDFSNSACGAILVALQAHGILPGVYNPTEPREPTPEEIWGTGDDITGDDITGIGPFGSEMKKKTIPQKSKPEPIKPDAVQQAFYRFILQLWAEVRNEGIKNPRKYLIEVFKDGPRRVQFINRRFGLPEGRISSVEMFSHVLDYVEQQAQFLQKPTPGPEYVPEVADPDLPDIPFEMRWGYRGTRP